MTKVMNEFAQTIVRCNKIELALNKKGLTEYDESTIETLDEIRRDAEDGFELSDNCEYIISHYENRLNIKYYE